MGIKNQVMLIYNCAYKCINLIKMFNFLTQLIVYRIKWGFPNWD